MINVDKERYDSELRNLDNFSNNLHKPKKCLSAYMIFVQETRPVIVRDNPDMGALDIMKQVGYQWQGLTEKQRQYFQDKADVDKVRYLKEMKAFYDEIERIGHKAGSDNKIVSAEQSDEDNQEEAEESQE